MPMPVISAYDFANFSEETFSENSPLKSFYRGKIVLVTGGTGDLGQVYVEKLLRCNIKRLYLLIRPAITGEDATTTEDRLKLLLDTALFASLRKSHSNLINLIHPITGDLASPQLGLSSADRSILCENVQLIVHAGFETNFAAPLRRAALTNVRGTRELLQLAADCANLQAFGHVSTVFAQQPQTVCKPGCDTDDRLPIEERFYSTSIDPHRLLAILESNNATMDERTLETLANSLMRPWTNTYAFTMALAESLVQEASNSTANAASKTAFVVVRPAAVLSTLEDPVAGYTTSEYGLNELFIAVSTGAMRVLPRCDDRDVAPICLSDFAVNITLAAMQRSHSGKDGSAATAAAAEAPLVLNASVMSAGLQWSQLFNGIVENTKDKPILRSVWRPRAHLMRCRSQMWWFVWLYELLPALLCDFALRIVGCPARLMPRMRRNVEARREYAPVMGSRWNLAGDQTTELYEGLDKSDRAFFPFDMTAFDWNDYSYKHALGLKRYVLGENLNNLEMAQRRQRNYRMAHIGVLIVYYAAVVSAYGMLFWSLGGCTMSRRLLTVVM